MSASVTEHRRPWQATVHEDSWITGSLQAIHRQRSKKLMRMRPERSPMMPEYGLGFWQCKLRYQTQEELRRLAREYHRRVFRSM